MKVSRREHSICLRVNGQAIHKVIIDPHFEEKHSDTISDEIILGLVRTLDGATYEPDAIVPPFAYFVSDGLFYQGRKYRLVWLIEEHQIYIGVVNAYRR